MPEPRNLTSFRNAAESRNSASNPSSLSADWLQAQNEILEQIVTSRPVIEILDSIVRMLQASLPDSMGSFMVLDAENRLQLVSGPSLPSDYVHRMRDVPVGLRHGSCGSAAYTLRPSVVSDTLTDERWQDYQDIVRTFGFRSCWSFPVVRTNKLEAKCKIAAPSHGAKPSSVADEVGKVFGVFAVYHRYPKTPTSVDIDRIEQAVRLAAIALENHLNEENARESERRFRDLADAVPQIVWTADKNGRFNYRNQRLLDTIGDTYEWASLVHPDDLQMALNKYVTALSTGEPYHVEHRLRVKPNGEYRWFLSRAIASRGLDGSVTGWFGVATDIDDLKRTERALREERDRYRRSQPHLLVHCFH